MGFRTPAVLAAIAALPLAACGPGGTATDREARDTYREQITGRWSALPDCGGMMWNFQRDVFTTPGETHCARIAVAEAPGGAVRVHGSECAAEGAAQSDVVLDIVLTEDGRIDVTGFGNAISTLGWRRCEN